MLLFVASFSFIVPLPKLKRPFTLSKSLFFFFDYTLNVGLALFAVSLTIQKLRSQLALLGVRSLHKMLAADLSLQARRSLGDYPLPR